MSISSHQQNNSGEAKRPLKRMFDAVPARYDILNRILTFGFDERWRKRAARACLERRPSRVLDLGCGTGDLACHIGRLGSASLEITGLDYSAAMLDVARQKADKLSLATQIRFVEGDAGEMSFPDDHFDAVGIAFAFRNLTWKNPLKDAALAEVLRVLTPGGTFVIVETSQPNFFFLRVMFHNYLRIFVARVGAVISGQGGAYRYLAESARRFYDSTEVCSMLGQSGFVNIRSNALLGGIAAIHLSEKPDR